jgi:hypothetical protein
MVNRWPRVVKESVIRIWINDHVNLLSERYAQFHQQLACLIRRPRRFAVIEIRSERDETFTGKRSQTCLM